jgi:hypothetical protein
MEARWGWYFPDTAADVPNPTGWAGLGHLYTFFNWRTFVASDNMIEELKQLFFQMEVLPPGSRSVRLYRTVRRPGRHGSARVFIFIRREL